MNNPPSGEDRPTLPDPSAPQYAPPSPIGDPTQSGPSAGGQQDPPPPRESSDRTTRLLVTGAAVVAVLAAVAIALVLVKGNDTTTTSSSRRSTEDASTSKGSSEATTTTAPAHTSTSGGSGTTATTAPQGLVTLPTTTQTVTTTFNSTGTYQPTNGTDAQSQLDTLAITDESTAATTIADHWVAQLSSKWVGLRADGTTWTADSILAEHQQLRSRYGALLLDSTDWGFKRSGVWVTVTNSWFPTADLANAWCDDQGFAKDHCFAKRIHRGAQERGDTKSRG